MIERQVFYHGRVQGVGFRYTVKQIASGYEVTGWVRNLSDGRVELQVRGEKTQVEEFLAAISASNLKHHIREQHEGELPVLNAEIRGFEIRH